MDQTGVQPAARTSQFSEEFLTEKLPVGWPWRLLISAAFLFLFSIFVFVGLKFGYTSYLVGERKRVDASIDQLAKQVTSEDKEKFVSFYSQIVNLKKALGDHLFSYNIFSFLEKNTVPSVTYTNASMEGESQTLTLDGTTPEFDAVAGQVTVFERQPEVAVIALDKVSLTSGNTVFTIKITFKDDFLTKPAF